MSVESRPLGDFAVVRRNCYYVGEIDNIKEDEKYEAKYFRKAPDPSKDKRIFLCTSVRTNALEDMLVS